MSSDGARDDYGDGGDGHKMIKCTTWKQEREKAKLYGYQGIGIA
jgi:hypothetical protein